MEEKLSIFLTIFFADKFMLYFRRKVCYTILRPPEQDLRFLAGDREAWEVSRPVPSRMAERSNMRP